MKNKKRKKENQTVSLQYCILKIFFFTHLIKQITEQQHSFYEQFLTILPML